MTTKFISKIDCIVRESNPGRPRGRRAFYHWTNDAVLSLNFMQKIRINTRKKKIVDTIRFFHFHSNKKPPWRNWLARSAVNRKVGGSSPPGGANILHFTTGKSLSSTKVFSISAGFEPAIFWSVVRRVIRCATRPNMFPLGRIQNKPKWVLCVLPYKNREKFPGS